MEENQCFPFWKRNITVTQKCEIATFCEMVRNSFPNNLGKTASPVLVPLYHDFAELNNRLKDENIQLNIGLHQGADSGSLLAFAYKRMLSIIISKLKGIISSKNEQ